MFWRGALCKLYQKASVRNPGLSRLVLHIEADFLLEVWGRDPRSVGQRGGLVV